MTRWKEFADVEVEELGYALAAAGNEREPTNVEKKLYEEIVEELDGRDIKHNL